MPTARARKPVANQLRIIGGQWRSRILHFPDSESLRPTPQRVRETLFNWLGQDLTGLAVLDLFAGSGALAFESLSRGAALAVAVDNDPQVIRSLSDNAKLLNAHHLEVHRVDAAAFLTRETRRFDLITADPPFSQSWFPKLWTLLAPRIAPGGWLYVEQARPVEVPDGWELHRQRKAGQVHYHLLRRAGNTTGPTLPQPRLNP